MENKLIMATLAGSHLYGTSRPDSDVDVRGICFSPPNALIGLQGFEQFQPSGQGAIDWSRSELGVESDDVTIYALSKFFMLCIKANPNIVELLFAPSTKIIHASAAWDEIQQRRGIFLSTKIIHTFAGYAHSQLSRIQRHKRWLDDPPTEPNPADYGLYSDDAGAQKWDDEHRANVYRGLRKRYKDYQTWRKNRNPARAKLEAMYGYDVKHAAHLYRLSMEAEELLTTGKLVLPLKDDARETYNQVINGLVPYDVVVMKAESLRDYLRALEANSVLPKRPDHKAAEELLMWLQWEHLKEIMNE